MAISKCPRCSAELPAGARFCAECGTPTGAGTVGGRPVEAAAGGRNTIRRDLAIVAGVLVVAVAAYVIFQRPQVTPTKPAAQPQTAEDAHAGMNMDQMAGGLGNLPADFDGLVQSGNHYMDQGNFAVAAECYRRALAINADAPNVRVDFGACLHRMGLPQRALQELSRVVREHPDHPIANYNLGFVYFGEHQKDSARTYFEKYLAIEPSGGAAETARDYLKKIEAAP